MAEAKIRSITFTHLLTPVHTQWPVHAKPVSNVHRGTIYRTIDRTQLWLGTEYGRFASVCQMCVTLSPCLALLMAILISFDC